ncbi:hypothetical protein [Streptomyces hyaluromycini]|uniref:hypothetical protein n=1 Tax=Streptomyces hyaluromycini TaxID=1377993 RepID=UPI0012382568|nr:hypothetical protein [Streptomyces hyaluromycini]
MGKLRVLATAVSAGTVALLAVGCGSGGPGRAAPARGTSSPPASATTRPASVAGTSFSVTKAPAYPGGEVVAQAANATGSREMDIKGGVGDIPLDVLVNCEGKGELTVAVEPLGVSFPFACTAGQADGIANGFDLKRPHTPGTVRVTASAGVRWAITVARPTKRTGS